MIKEVVYDEYGCFESRGVLDTTLCDKVVSDLR